MSRGILLAFVLFVTFCANPFPVFAASEALTRDPTTKVVTDYRTAGISLVRSDLTGLTGGGSTNLDGVVTAGMPLLGLPTNTVFSFIVSGDLVTYRLRAGTDAESSPSIIRPDDYNGATNARVWQKISAAASVDTDDQTAAEVPFTPAGNIIATNVQTALVELDSEKLAANATAFNGVTITGSSTPSIAVTGTTTISGTHAGTSSGTNTGDQDLSGLVPKTTTVNGHPLSANVTVTASDVSLGNVTNAAQTLASIVPNTAPSAGQILIGNAGGTAYAPQTMSGDATLASTGALTLATVASAGTTGSSTAIPVITIDAKGRTTGITTAAVVAPAGTLSGSTLASGVTSASITTLSALTTNGLVQTSGGTGALSVTAAPSITSLTLSSLTSGRVTFATTAGLLADDADMTFATDTLTVTKATIGSITHVANAIGAANSVTSASGSSLILATGTFGTAATFANSTGALTLAQGALSFTGATTITGGAGNMTVTAGTGASTRSITFVTIESDSTPGNALVLDGNSHGATIGGTITIGALTGTSSILGSAGNMIITAGTGNSRTMAFRTTTSGGTATTALTLEATQAVTIGGVNLRFGSTSGVGLQYDTPALQLRGSLNSAGFNVLDLNNISGSITITSGNINGVHIRTANGGFSPTSGTATYAFVFLDDVVNQTGGANGITRGIYINPTLTAAADFRAIEFGSGLFKVSASGAITTASTITTLGGATFHTTSSALTDGAGAGAGTILNAPTAGNPTKWIGINDNGTTRYVPAW